MSLNSLLLKLAKTASTIPLVGDDLAREVNRVAINHFAGSIPARPRPTSMWSPAPAASLGQALPPDYVVVYTSWPGLTNRQFSGRHLPPVDPGYVPSLPAHRVWPPDEALGAADRVTKLFERQGPMKPSRSSLLFMFFAQWFTDSVFRFSSEDRRQNTSNHDIDLCEIYGLTEANAHLLRSHESGRLRSQLIGGEEFPEYLCEADQAGVVRVKSHFEKLLPTTPEVTADQFVNLSLIAARLGDGIELEPRKAKLYATGLERGNSSIGYVAISVIFLREHNRLAREILALNPTWDDERVFQTARNVNTVILLKLIVEDYINHIVGQNIFRLDPAFAEGQQWYRQNWITAEFDLLYRWHGLVPDTMQVDGERITSSQFRFNNGLLETHGVGRIIDSASRQPAGKVSLRNTPRFLLNAESWSIEMGRQFRLQPFNAYRKRFGLDPIEKYSDLTSDRAQQRDLAELYPNIEDLELVVGLFAEEADPGMLFGDLLNQMVAYDALTQIFTNPLLSKNVYGAATFTEYGLQQIGKTSSIDDLVDRNLTTPVRASLGL